MLSNSGHRGLTFERNLRTLFTAPFSFLRIDGRKKLSNGITNTAFTITFRTFNVISLTYFWKITYRVFMKRTCFFPNPLHNTYITTRERERQNTENLWQKNIIFSEHPLCNIDRQNLPLQFSNVFLLHCGQKNSLGCYVKETLMREKKNTIIMIK